MSFTPSTNPKASSSPLHSSESLRSDGLVMEVVSAAPSMDLSLDSATSTPYITAPSSPQAFCNFFNPCTARPLTTAWRSRSDFDLRVCEEFHEISLVSDEDEVERSWNDDPRFSIAFAWENALPTVIHTKREDGRAVNDDGGEDFVFDLGGCSCESSAASADEIFHGGKIRPLKSSPPQSSAESRDDDTAGGKPLEPGQISRVEEFGTPCYPEKGRERGRERNVRPSSSSSSSPSFGRKGTRSLSPLRISDILLERDDEDEENSVLNIHKNLLPLSSSSPSGSFSSSSTYFSSLISFSKGDRRKWSFKDLLLFRSASEGRGTSKDPFRKYSPGFKPGGIADRPGSGSSQRATESTHESHYRMKRTASEEMKRRTALPYKHGLLGCWVNGGGGGSRHEIARGLGS
ncbi:uncharacterized protein LOC115737239 [Rhodamnia argentea]|uniref:Uncharacterized protein LOC115737239 n=1 Tax=Rhodamnia argentea TaxID=178133 RepID=A0A8B8NRK3_9MYRT|nr:uncharacterized protein LOC115737239 [Rhodamnia argentea]